MKSHPKFFFRVDISSSLLLILHQLLLFQNKVVVCRKIKHGQNNTKD